MLPLFNRLAQKSCSPHNIYLVLKNAKIPDFSSLVFLPTLMVFEIVIYQIKGTIYKIKHVLILKVV